MGEDITIQIDINFIKGYEQKDFDILKLKNQTGVNFAAESHVDNSVKNPEIFLKTNILGTFNLLEGIGLSHPQQMIHISTDEVTEIYLNDHVYRRKSNQS